MKFAGQSVAQKSCFAVYIGVETMLVFPAVFQPPANDDESETDGDDEYGMQNQVLLNIYQSSDDDSTDEKQEHKTEEG